MGYHASKTIPSKTLKSLSSVLSKDKTYENWKQLLIAVTQNKLATAGVYREFKINDDEAKSWFESGASPLQCFRENFEL